MAEQNVSRGDALRLFIYWLVVGLPFALGRLEDDREIARAFSLASNRAASAAGYLSQTDHRTA